MNDKYLSLKKEIEKINQRIKSIFEKNKIFSKLESINNEMLKPDFWNNKVLSQNVVKEKNF